MLAHLPYPPPLLSFREGGGGRVGIDGTLHLQINQ